MDVGTAKPTSQEQSGVRHHLIDICTIDKPYSAAEFKRATDKVIKDIQKRGKLPFLVGGSGMYIDAVLYDFKFRNEENTVTIQALKNKSLSELQGIAQQKYPQDYFYIDQKNRRRVEQLIIKGPSKDDDIKNANIKSLVLGVAQNKALLKQNIATRTNYMLNNNLVQETRQLRKKYGDTDILLHTTGYAQVLKYLDNQISKDHLAQSIVDATWQLSRKQMTWFKRNKHIQWISNMAEAEVYIKKYI